MLKGFFFLDTTKSWLHLDLFTAIFLILSASSVFSPGRIWDEILLRHVVFGAPGRWDLRFIDDKAVSRLVCRDANTVTVNLSWD